MNSTSVAFLLISCLVATLLPYIFLHQVWYELHPNNTIAYKLYSIVLSFSVMMVCLRLMKICRAFTFLSAFIVLLGKLNILVLLLDNSAVFCEGAVCDCILRLHWSLELKFDFDLETSSWDTEMQYELRLSSIMIGVNLLTHSYLSTVAQHLLLRSFTVVNCFTVNSDHQRNENSTHFETFVQLLLYTNLFLVKVDVFTFCILFWS